MVRNPVYLGNDDFSSIFTFVRELFFFNGKLHQLPIDTVQSLRQVPLVVDRQFNGQSITLPIPELSEIQA